MAKDEADLVSRGFLELLQLPERPPAKWALEVAILGQRHRSIGVPLRPVLRVHDSAKPAHGLASVWGCGRCSMAVPSSSCLPVTCSSASRTPSAPGFISIGDT